MDDAGFLLGHCRHGYARSVLHIDGCRERIDGSSYLGLGIPNLVQRVGNVLVVARLRHCSFEAGKYVYCVYTMQRGRKMIKEKSQAVQLEDKEPANRADSQEEGKRGVAGSIAAGLMPGLESAVRLNAPRQVTTITLSTQQIGPIKRPTPACGYHRGSMAYLERSPGAATFSESRQQNLSLELVLF